MKHWMKRSLAVLLCMVMLCSVLPDFAARAEEIELIPIDDETVDDVILIDEDEIAAEAEAVSNGDGTTAYRALLIGQTYNDVTKTSINPLYGDLSVGMMKTLLKGVNGGEGGSFTVTSQIDASYNDIYDLIDDLSYEADDDDVTIFYYNGHGVVTGSKDDAAGALVTVESDGGINYVYSSELANWLGYVPGKVVVILDSCGAGACITNGGGDAALFGELAVKAFAEKDGAVSNVGEMRTSKFYVLAAAPYNESSYAFSGIGGELTYALKGGAEGTMAADTNGDSVATLNELYTYIDNEVCADQTTCVYPTNSSFKVFAKLEKPVITTQPKTTTICAGTDVSFKVVADGATSYQWYYRTSSSGSWAKSTVSTATKATLKYTNVSIGHNGYQYRCKVSNANGYVYTKAATLKVTLAPVITTQPKDLTISSGGDATFTVKASGALSYQWYWRENENDSWRKSTVSTATSATLKYSNLSSSKSGRQYRCCVANDKAYVYTNVVTLTVLGKPNITTQPANVSSPADTTVKFTVVASGATSYQWYYRTSSSGSWSKTSLSGNATATLSVKALASRHGYQYRCKVSNDYGYVYSSAATLTIQSTAPIIMTQPKDLTIGAGGDATFTVKAANALSYQWQWRKNSSDSWKNSTVSTGTSATLVYSNLGADKSGRQYRCLVANDKAYVYTNVVTLTVTSSGKPTISTQPSNVSATADSTAKFTVAANNATGYQWYYRTSSSGSWAKTSLSGCTTPTLSVKALSSRNGYQYRCKVSNANGYVYTNTVTLTVSAASTVTYRALVIGQTYEGTTDPFTSTLNCDLNAQMMKEALSSVQGAKGGSITVTKKVDISRSGMKNAISTAFAAADDDDVSIFYYSGHGVSPSTGDVAGALVTLESDKSVDYVYLYELASWLKDVPGKVVVILDSCGSGAAVYQNGQLLFLSDLEAASLEAFNSAAVSAFAEADETLPLPEGEAQPNTGEFRNSKFYVLTGAAHRESAWGGSSGGLFTIVFTYAIGSDKPADANGNGIITLSELYDFTYDLVYEISVESELYEDGNRVYQHVQVYPANSSYELFR